MPRKGYSSGGDSFKGHRELIRRWRAEGREAVSPNELAQALGVKTYTIRSAYQAGHLPYTRINRLIRLFLADVERWLELSAGGQG